MDKYLLSEFDGDSVLLNTETGQYFSINETGLFVWRHLQERLEPKEIACRLEATFGVSREQAYADVASFLSALRSAGLLPGSDVR
jgi:hypothetical protein